MLQFGGLDQRVNATWPDDEKGLKANKVDDVAHVYEGANHGFHHDSPGRDSSDDAALAWKRTIPFFQKPLS